MLHYHSSLSYGDLSQQNFSVNFSDMNTEIVTIFMWTNVVAIQLACTQPGHPSVASHSE